MNKKTALIGYSGHALVVAETLIDAGFEVIGYFEHEPKKNNPLNLDYLGSEKEFNFSKLGKTLFFFPAIGSNIIRKNITLYLLENNCRLVIAISPYANVSSDLQIKPGSLICKGACVNPQTRIGMSVILNTSAVIEHECQLEDFVHVAPGAVLAGNVKVGEGSFIGANAVVKQGIRIGSYVIIGAGSVVLENVPDNETWVGNPARKIE